MLDGKHATEKDSYHACEARTRGGHSLNSRADRPEFVDTFRAPSKPVAIALAHGAHQEQANS